MIYKVLAPSQVVFSPDFWTINSSTWKWMAGIWSFPFGFRPIFRGYVKFPQCKRSALTSSSSKFHSLHPQPPNNQDTDSVRTSEDTRERQRPTCLPYDYIFGLGVFGDADTQKLSHWHFVLEILYAPEVFQQKLGFLSAASQIEKNMFIQRVETLACSWVHCWLSTPIETKI